MVEWTKPDAYLDAPSLLDIIYARHLFESCMMTRTSAYAWLQFCDEVGMPDPGDYYYHHVYPEIDRDFVKQVRNKFEAKFQALHPGLEYETVKLKYTLDCTYNPDFIDHASKTIYETKGLFDAADRRKILAVKKQHPDWRIVMVFQYPHRKISKSSKTSYAIWCEKNSIDWQTVDAPFLST